MDSTALKEFAQGTQVALSSLMNGTKPDFAGIFRSKLEELNADYTGLQNKTIHDYLLYIDSKLMELAQIISSIAEPQSQLDKAKSLIAEALQLLESPDMDLLSKSINFAHFTLDCYNEHSLEIMRKINADDSFSPPINPAKKRRLCSNSEQPIDTNNSFVALSAENNSKMNIDPVPEEVVEKTKIHPIFLEINDSYKNQMKTISELCSETPDIKLTGELLKIICKNPDDFRKVQSMLSENNLKFTTLAPDSQRPKKIVVRGIPTCTQESEIISEFKNLGFTCTRASMMRNRRTATPMPLYLCNFLPQDNFQEIFKITKLGYLSVSIEPLKNKNNFKQCRRCQIYGHHSETCKLTPKCHKCAQPHLTNDCPTKGIIPNPKCALCNGDHVSSSKLCPKHPLNVKNSKKNNSPLSQQFPPPVLPLTRTFSSILFQNLEKAENNGSLSTRTSSVDGACAQTPILLPKTNDVSSENLSTQSVPTDGDRSPTTNKTEKNSSPPQKSDLDEITNTFNELKDMLQVASFLKLIQRIVNKCKGFKNPLDKMWVMLQEFENFTQESSTSNHE